MDFDPFIAFGVAAVGLLILSLLALIDTPVMG